MHKNCIFIYFSLMLFSAKNYPKLQKDTKKIWVDDNI